MRTPRTLVFLLCSTSFFVAGRALAGGFEYPAQGSRALGRGGAFSVKADDPMALLYNPANLAGFSGPHLSLQSNLSFLGACVKRPESYTYRGPEGPSGRMTDYVGPRGDISEFGDSEIPPEEGGYLDVEFPRVCNDGPPTFTPNLVFAMPLGRKLGIGAGIITPAGTNVRWGNANGTVPVDGVDAGRLPSPVRYGLVEQNVTLLYPTIGVGYELIEGVRIGLSLAWGLGMFHITNYTRPYNGESPSLDIRTELQTKDLFIPRGTFSVHVNPIAPIELMAAFTYTDTVRSSGTLDLTWADFAADGTPGRGEKTRIKGSSLTVPQPWQLAAGVRYVSRRAQGMYTSGVRDAMVSEHWDIELDVVYEASSRVDEQVVRNPKGSTIDTGSLAIPIPDRIEIPTRWKDQLSLRLGGDYNVLPGLLTVRGGASYESRGVSSRYMHLDFFPVRRFGLHAGATVRIYRFDVSLAYAHFFQETIDVPLDHARAEQIVAQPDPSLSGTPNPTIVNAGRYTSNLDVLSLAVDYHF